MPRPALRAVNNQQVHPRDVARQQVAKWRAGKAIDPKYDFNAAPVEARRVIYDMTVRFSRRVWWSRLLR